jgi:hypothetical protein
MLDTIPSDMEHSVTKVVGVNKEPMANTTSSLLLLFGTNSGRETLHRSHTDPDLEAHEAICIFAVLPQGVCWCANRGV